MVVVVVGEAYRSRESVGLLLLPLLMQQWRSVVKMKLKPRLMIICVRCNERERKRGKGERENP